MTDFAAYLYRIMPFVTTSAWLGVLIWLAPRVRRLFTPDFRRFDLLAGAFALLTLNRLWFQGSGFLFGRHIEVRTVNEIIWSDAAQIWSMFCAVFVVVVFSRYECQDARR